MPATAITPVQVGHKAPAALPLAAAGTAMDPTNGNSVANGGQTVLLVFNSGASAHTFEVAFGSTVDGQARPTGDLREPGDRDRQPRRAQGPGAAAVTGQL